MFHVSINSSWLLAETRKADRFCGEQLISFLIFMPEELGIEFLGFILITLTPKI